MILSDLLQILIDFQKDRKKDAQERLSKYLDDIAENAANLADAWTDILSEYQAGLDSHLPYISGQDFLHARLQAIELTHMNVLEEDIKEFEELTRALRGVLDSRGIAREYLDSCATQTRKLLVLEEGPQHEYDADKMYKFVSSIQEEAAKLQVIALNYRSKLKGAT